MKLAIRIPSLFIASFLSLAPFASSRAAQIEFDVPALVGAREIATSALASNKTIEIVLPVSTVIDSKLRGAVDEFRFDVSWNDGVYPLVGFGPKTTTVSDVKGLLSVEENSSQNSSLGLSFNSKPFDLASANLNSDIGMGSATRKSFQEIPQHDVLVASGTIDRGTGAFFRFHPSRTQTLEGSRDLMLTWQVPTCWQTGLIQVQCRVTGNRTVAGLWTEPFEFGRAFIVPLFLENDPNAQQLAIDFARAEQEFRKSWIKFEKELKTKRASSLFPSLTFKNQLPQQWPHLLIQSGDERYLSEYEGYITKEVAFAAGKFLAARKGLKAKHWDCDKMDTVELSPKQQTASPIAQ